MGYTKRSAARSPVFEHQADVTLSQANPVSGTKYTLLDTTANMRIISLVAKVTWTVQPTPLQAHITIDGVSLESHKDNPVSATYYSFSNTWPDTADFGLDAVVSQYNGIILEGRSIKIEVETTGGTTSSLEARLKYAVIP